MAKAETFRNALNTDHLLHWYRIERVLGQGGFGITYLAFDNNLQQEVAIKEYLPMELAVREGDNSVFPVSDRQGDRFKWGLDRFLAEARTLAKFRHPGIVRVLSVFEANNTAYMVMEYERGETLQELLSRRKTLRESEIDNILSPILDGLEQVHKSGFIHRDIKPANIFLRENNTAVLIDFGSARQALGQETRTLTSIVSPGYAPYEQYYSKSDKQGPWTDIYGLAATLYRAISGRIPPNAIDRSESILKAERDALVSAVEIGAGKYRKGLLEGIDHGLCFNEKDRPQSITEWRTELYRSVPLDVEAPLSNARTRFGPQDGVTTQIATEDAFRARTKQTTRLPSEGPTVAVPPRRSPWLMRAVQLVLVLAAVTAAAYFGSRYRGALPWVKSIQQKIAAAAPPSTPTDQTDVRNVENSQPEEFPPLEMEPPAAQEQESKPRVPVEPVSPAVETPPAAAKSAATAPSAEGGSVAASEETAPAPAPVASPAPVTTPAEAAPTEVASNTPPAPAAPEPTKAVSTTSPTPVVPESTEVAAAAPPVSPTPAMPVPNEAVGSTQPGAAASGSNVSATVPAPPASETPPSSANATPAKNGAPTAAGTASSPSGSASSPAPAEAENVSPGPAPSAPTSVAMASPPASSATLKEPLAPAPASTPAPAPSTPPAPTPMAAPPVPAGPSPAELAAEKQRAEISKLLTLAQADLKANRLTTPKDNNALSRYEAVLERDPQNAEAQQGIDAVANRYATLAAMSIDNGDLDKAASLLERGRKAKSDADSLDRVADRLRTAREEAAKEKAAAAEAAKEKAAAEEAAREQAAQEEAAREQAAKEQAAKEQAAREEAEKQRQLALAQPPPPAAPPPAPSVAITFDGFKHDYDRFGLTTAKLRQEAAVRLQKAGYVVAGSSPASLYARFKLRIVVNTTSGIASYSTHLDIAGSPWTPTASPLVEWQSGQSGTMRSFEIGRLNEIYIKLIERFIQERPPARQ